MKYKRLKLFFATLLAFTFNVQGITNLFSDVVHTIAFASAQNIVAFENTSAQANGSNFVIAKIVVSGKKGETVNVSYKTYSRSAIRSVDFNSVENTISLRIGDNGKAEYEVAVKCLNNSTNREKLRVYSEKDTEQGKERVQYGRYFDLKITKASNMSGEDNTAIDTNKDTCKCYLTYDGEAQATVSYDSYNYRYAAYLNDYKNMIMKFEDGTSSLDGKDTRKSWKKGVSFDNDTTRQWINKYINTGFADAYGSFLVKCIDDGFWDDSGKVSVAAGNKQFIDNYKMEKDRPGMYFYGKVNPPGTKLNGRAMEKIFAGQNAWDKKKDPDLVDISMYTKSNDHRKIYWILEKDVWFASKNSIYDTEFCKIEPYNGVLDQGVAGYNHNKECDMEFNDIWLLMTLYDSKAPVLTGKYCDFNEENGALRIYLRFNEPVFVNKPNSANLTVTINGNANPKEAAYVDGNFSDTLVYEVNKIDLPTEKITSVNYQIPAEEIGDLSYKLTAYRTVESNYVLPTRPIDLDIIDGYIDLTKPNLNVVDDGAAGSSTPRNRFDIILSANDGTKIFNEGTIHYTWSTDESLADDFNPASYKYHHVLTSEEKGSFNVTLAKNQSEGITGGKYYLFAMAEPKRGEKKVARFGYYKLDGDAPVVKGMTFDQNDLKTKIYNFEVQNKALDTELSKVTFNASYKDAEGKEVKKSQILVDNGEVVPSLTSIVKKITSDTTTTFQYKSNIDSTSEIPLDPFIQELMGTSSRVQLSVNFIVEDEAGNRATSNTYTVAYDIRTVFTPTVEFPSSYHEDETVDPSRIGDDVSVYDIREATPSQSITFTVPEGTTSYRTDIDNGAKLSLIVNDEPLAPVTGYSASLTGLKAGHYRVIARISGETTLGHVDMISKTIDFILTDDSKDETENRKTVDGNLVLTNSVYQLEDVRFYYFDPTGVGVNNHLYGAVYNSSNDRYEGGSASPTFSNSMEAKKYVKYMEYQDLHVVSISDTIASVLNSGAGGTQYVKATGETKKAQANQLWIRYKRNTWTPTYGTAGWAYYYYGDGSVEDGININALSSNLTAAIEAVVNRIIGSGGEKYLVQEEDLDLNTGAPYLGNSQMHVDKEEASVTKTGISFVTKPTYLGDGSLYQNDVSVNSTLYPLATNMVLKSDGETKLFFHYLGDTIWLDLPFTDGMRLSEAVYLAIKAKAAQDSSVEPSTATGVYIIREYSSKGVSEYPVYVDTDLPILNVTYTIDGVETTTDLDGEGVSSIGCESFVINNITNEADSLSFVAIYSYPSKVLQRVMYRDEIPDAHYTISGGNYYVQVGDRSGNMVTYTVLTATSDIDLSLTESDSKTGVYVKVGNRSDSEIYSYEVYLNETLIDTEFAESKFYRDAGIYRVVVTDIYGKTETKVLTHESPTPEITWYYLNDSETYSPYNPEKPVRMYLEDDPSTPRTTNVYSSTLIRLIFKEDYQSGDVEFEVIGIESSDYTYNNLTGSLSINSLSSWRLRVWYKNQPENDHTYVFHLDNNAPEINATFIGSIYHYDSSFDTVNYESYNKGDKVTVDTLSYTEDGTDTTTLENNAIISGHHIVIAVSDSTDISSYTVKRNGVIQEMVLSSENKLILNSYGKYVLTFTDLLGNTATFTFTNLEGAMANGTVDDEIMGENLIMYGHGEMAVETLFNGTNTILVKSDDRSATYIFVSDGKRVTYGQYVVKQGEKDEDGEMNMDKFSELVMNESFELFIDEDVTIMGRWYTAVEDLEYNIYVMINTATVKDEEGKNKDEYRVHYKVVSLDTPIHVESSFSVGKTHLPSRFVANLSNEVPNITLLTGDEEVEQKKDLEYIYIADNLTIKEDSVDKDVIKTIEYAYSLRPEFATYTTIFKDGKFVQSFVGEDDGFYKIVVTNIYNNQTVYLISKIDSFVSTVTITTLDKSSVVFYGNSGDTIRSNSKIRVDVYSDSVSFIINGVEQEGHIEKGVTYIELSKEGTYEFIIKGDNGIHEDFTFEIGTNEEFVFDESWIYGYNEEALMRDEGYSNKPLSIKLGENVVFIDVVINDELYVKLYDDITENKQTDLNELVGAIGRYGVGKYTVGFRDKFGDLVTKTVYFNDVPALYLDRIITSEPSVYEEYDLDFALTHDFYSNYVLRFSTTSVAYVFTINGEEYRLDEPKILEFSNSSGNGSFSYDVTYLDEYGNYVQFKAVLSRKDLTIDVSKMNTVTSNGDLYTRDDICILFEDGLKATVSIDGETPISYDSGFVYYGDGRYAFIVRDIAGNRYFYTINHKSMNHYSLVRASSEESIISGSVVNNANVTFVPTDNSRLKYVFKDGELMSDYTSSNFTQTGHWEIIIEDFLGNQSYEDFYILKNELYQFTYTAPFEYEVVEVWRVKPDGTREMLNYRGKTITLVDNGDYVVSVANSNTHSTFNFTVTINDAPPTAKLNGVENNEVTANDVSISGLKSGDIVKIYKDGELISTTVVGLSSEIPSITTGGRYRVTITNVQGVTVEYNFVRKSIANAAGSIFVIVTAGLLITGIVFGLVYHTKLKTDD